MLAACTSAVIAAGVPTFPQHVYVPVDYSNETTARFAIIGDYGNDSGAESDVAALVKSWNPDFIITTGDNNYGYGSAFTIDENIGKYYGEFIYPYSGEYWTGDSGVDMNRFFPTLGNHDWKTRDAQPYLDYFTLPGNERYYDFTWGPVHFFAIDSDSNEPDGVTVNSIQATWLRDSLASSTSPWKIVYMHHPPYSSGEHGSSDKLQWPYQEWGATAVVAGHDHSYERIVRNGFPYFINGSGGGDLRDWDDIVAGSEVRFCDDHGAMLVEASSDSITFQFISRTGEVIDTYSITSCVYNTSSECD